MPSLDDLGTKQFISGTPAGEDLVPFYDLSEFGNAPVKKAPLTSLVAAMGLDGAIVEEQFGGWEGGDKGGGPANSDSLNLQSGRVAFDGLAESEEPIPNAYLGIPASLTPYYAEVLPLTAAEHTTTGEFSVSLGYACASLGSYSVAVGSKARAIGERSMAVGSDVLASQQYGVAVGYNVRAVGTWSLAFGNTCFAGGDDASAIGYNCYSYGTDACAIGTDCYTYGSFSSAYGNTCRTWGTKSTTIGYACESYGAESWSAGCLVKVGTANVQELGHRSSEGATRSSMIRLHSTGMAAISLQNRATAYVDATNTTACAITQAAGVATVTLASHGFIVGSRVDISGASQAGYNITKATVLSVPTANTFTYAVDSGTVTPATGSPVCKPHVGSERDNEIPAESFAIRRNGDVLLIDVNIGGTIKTLSLGTAA